MKIVCWQTILTEHQVHTLRALNLIPGVELTIVIGERLLNERKDQGWSVPFWDDLNIISIAKTDTDNWWKTSNEILREYRDSIHIFNGLWGDKRFFFLILKAAFLMKIKIGLLSEPYSDIKLGYYTESNKLVGNILWMLRPRLYRLAGLMLKKRVGPIFAISLKAVQQYSKSGFQNIFIYPYGYFIPQSTSLNTDLSRNEDGTLKIVFVGTFIKRKGYDIAIEAITKCHSKGINVSLDMYGSLPEQLKFQQNSLLFNYKGLIPFGKTPEIISNYDLVIVPSRYDGWSVVVNEALQANTPLLVSENTGASVLVKASGAGIVYNSAGVEELANIISNIYRNKNVIKEWAEKAEKYKNKINPEIAARYVYDCLNHYYGYGKKPVCPWYSV